MSLAQVRGAASGTAATANWATNALVSQARVYTVLKNFVFLGLCPFAPLLVIHGPEKAVYFAVCSSCSWAPQTFLSLTRGIGASGTFWLYAVVAAAGTVLVYYTLPETNGAIPACLM